MALFFPLPVYFHFHTGCEKNLAKQSLVAKNENH